MVQLNKKVVIISSVLILIVFIAVFYTKFFLQPTVVSPISDSILPTPTVIEPITLWQDQSEFSFRYPASLKLDPHEEDKENYSHVELTSATYSGNLIVWTQDTKASDNDDWIKKEKIQGAIDTTLASFPAKKFLSGNEPKTLNTIVIRNGYLYKIEANISGSDFWKKVFDTVTSSFAFSSVADQTKEETVQTQNQAPVSEESTEVFDEVVE